jgi:uncharacterized membrane protein
MTHKITWIADALQVLRNNSGWMSWNLFLAVVPFALSICLFRGRRSRSYLWWTGLFLFATFLPKGALFVKYGIRFLRDNRMNHFVWIVTSVFIALDIWLLRDRRSRSLLWWLGFFVFIAFLPNAPYVLTDVIHLVADIRRNYSIWMITLVVIPQYFLFTLIGFEAYVLSLISLGDYLKRQGWGKFILGTELILHGLSAVGIYLGRFLRFNSWDIVTELDGLAERAVDDLIGKRPIFVMAITFLVITALYWMMKQVSLGIIQRQQQAIAPKPNNSNPDTSTAGF